jgi:hypothetical protein
MFKKAFTVGFVLTAATWSLVDVKTPAHPLNGKDTTMVFGIWLGTALFALWLWPRVRRRKQHDPQKK